MVYRRVAIVCQGSGHFSAEAQGFTCVSKLTSFPEGFSPGEGGSKVMWMVQVSLFNHRVEDVVEDRSCIICDVMLTIGSPDDFNLRLQVATIGI